MSTTSLHTLYAVDVGSGTLIDEITNFNVDPGIQRMLRGVGGDVEPKFVSVMEQSPIISFGSLAIARALAAVGINGLAVAASPNQSKFYLQKMAQDGTRAGTLSHLKGDIHAGIIVPRQLTASQGQAAVITYDIIPRYDGTNEPIVLTASQTLAGSPVFDEMFTVGPVNINGALVPGVKEITINFGLQLVRDISAGDIWPTFTAIESRANPLITIRTVDTPQWETLGLDGVAQGATDSVVFFRKKLADGANVPNATAQHVSVSVDQGHIAVTGGPSMQHPQAGDCTITIAPTYDGVNAIMAVATATAIT